MSHTTSRPVTLCELVKVRLHREIEVYLEAREIIRGIHEDEELLPPVGLPDERDEPCEGCAGFGLVPAGLDWQELTPCPRCGGLGR